VELVGFNLPAQRTVKVTAGASGEMMLPLDAEKFRARADIRVAVSELPQVLEAEPNDEPARATASAAAPAPRPWCCP